MTVNVVEDEDKVFVTWAGTYLSMSTTDTCICSYK